MDAADTAPVINAKSLAISLSLLAVSCLVSAGVALTTASMAGNQAQMLKQAQAAQQETHARMIRARGEDALVRSMIASYQQVVARGRMQPERRLEWVETIKSIRESRRLVGLEFEIGPQRPLNDKMVSTGGHDFMTSPMKMSLPMLHENDLLGLLSDLADEVQALVSVRRCIIERETVVSAGPNATTLKSSCELDWITLREKL